MNKLTIAQQLRITEFPFEITDDSGNLIYIEMEDGFWIKWQWSNKRQMYCQNSSNYWEKREYDSSGNEIYYENSTGKIINNRPNPKQELQAEPMTIEINGKKYKLTEI